MQAGVVVGCLLSCSSPWFLRQGPPLDLEFNQFSQAGCPASFRELSVPVFPVWGLQVCTLNLDFYVGSGDQTQAFILVGKTLRGGVLSPAPIFTFFSWFIGFVQNVNLRKAGLSMWFRTVSQSS